MEKGDEIRFVRGSYAGRKGWLNDAKVNTIKTPMHHVIVLLDDDVAALIIVH